MSKLPGKQPVVRPPPRGRKSTSTEPSNSGRTQPGSEPSNNSSLVPSLKPPPPAIISSAPPPPNRPPNVTRGIQLSRRPAANTAPAVKFRDTASRPGPTQTKSLNALSNNEQDMLQLRKMMKKFRQSPQQDLLDADLEAHSWYHGLLSGDELQSSMTNDGDFAVRKVESDKASLSMIILTVSDKKKLANFHIRQDAQTSRWYIEHKEFDTVSNLVSWYTKTATPIGDLKCVIRTPILRHSWELRHEQIRLGKKLGRGEFGDVFVGYLKPHGERSDAAPIKVAVKTTNRRLSQLNIDEFLREAKIINKLADENVTKFYGVAADHQPIFLVMEYVNGGALTSFLRKHANKLTDMHLTYMIGGASKGLAYLHSKSIIHRDIASRNCLVAIKNRAQFKMTGTIPPPDELHVKLSDFGMSLEAESYTIQKGMVVKLPIKWLAPETLKLGVYTKMTDVWSFAVLMWEVYSLGAEPYDGMSTTETKAFVKGGNRMEVPTIAPKYVAAAILHCWSEEPLARPTMKTICDVIAGAIDGQGSTQSSGRGMVPRTDKPLVIIVGEFKSQSLVTPPLHKKKKSATSPPSRPRMPPTLEAVPSTPPLEENTPTTAPMSKLSTPPISVLVSPPLDNETTMVPVAATANDDEKLLVDAKEEGEEEDKDKLTMKTAVEATTEEDDNGSVVNKRDLEEMKFA